MDASLPINPLDLLRHRNIEGERIEFKAGWNPEAVRHTMCAFANDFHNLGGGYIVIGVEEKDGRAVLPPKEVPAFWPANMGGDLRGNLGGVSVPEQVSSRLPIKPETPHGQSHSPSRGQSRTA